ncbi:hypothetical protein SCACP_24430 [Sporomusa carbonis]|uniref:HNH endonuclease n=1 Tax=Sporomusa carbonis TaxID=3076075 RepID=UPI003A652C20
MPRKPKRPCSQPGCPELTDGLYCDWHRKDEYKEYNRFKRDAASKRFYGFHQWKKLRQQKLSRDPLCEHCAKESKVVPATVVDHIVPIKEGGAAWDMNNLQSLCRYHDDVKGLKDRKMI